jgi:PAS domain S-box-containing protein
MQTLGCKDKINGTARKRNMPNEPDIIKILREEERLGKLQTQSSGQYKTIQNSEDAPDDQPQDSLMLCKQDDIHNIHEMDPDQLEAVHKTIFETSAIAILIVDSHGEITSWNTSLQHLVGETDETLFKKTVSSLFPSEEWQKIKKQITEPQGLRYTIDTKMYSKQNNVLDVTVTVNILKNKQGTLLGFLYILTDITEQKKAQYRLNSIIEYADDSVYLLDNHFRYLMVNNELLSRLNCSRDEVLGKTFSDFHSPEETKEFTQKLQWVFEHGRPLRDEHCRDGNWFLRTLSPVKDSIAAQTSAVLVVSKDITENKKSEKQLAEKEKKYRTMFEFFPQTIVLLNKYATLLDVNERVFDWLGYKPSEIIGKDLFSLPFFTQDAVSIVKKNLYERMENKFVAPYELDFIAKTGEKHIGVVHATPLKNEHGDVIADLVVISDITERKHIEEILRVKESAITSSINAIALADLSGNITYVNRSFLNMWGYTNEKELLGKSLVQFWKIKEKHIDVMNSLSQKGEWIGELTAIRKDRSTFQVQLSANMITEESGKPICMMGSFVDITKYKKAVKALSESEKKFRVVLENSLDMIYQFNVKKKTCDYVSPSSIKVIGYSADDYTSFTLQKIEELIYPEDRERWNTHFKMITNYAKRKEVYEPLEYRIKHKQLGYRWLSDTCSAIFDEKHNPISVVGTIEDITDRKKVWDELVKSEEKYRILAETSADGVFTTDALGRLTYVNPSFERLCGRRKSQILATPFRNYLLEDSIYFFQQIFIDVRKKNEKIENVELDLVDGDGGIIPIEANIAPLQKDADFSGVVCTVRDITQRREIEDELKKNERLKTEFMNIAAHELRSPVTPIKGYLDLIIHDNESNDKIKNWAKISLRNAERLLKLVNDILDVSRLDSDTMRFDMEKINPVDLLNEIAEDMRPAITNKKLEFQLNIPKTLPHIIGDKIRLSQVLKNLIGNALKFTDTGFIAIHAEKKDDHLLISVEDTGIGISKDEIKKIFAKFYQAYTGEDRNNEGTGLGLFISKEIVKKHNGIIWAESDIGKGSRFIIQLPYIYKMTVDFTS